MQTRPGTGKPRRIGIIGAMAAELSLLRQALTNPHRVPQRPHAV
ncbi:MAG: hypothetical protein ACRYGK_09265 [Janthinobacterium lividum]